jgi:hypothetical protein
MRLTILILGLAPFALTHPSVRTRALPLLLAHPASVHFRRRAKARAVRAADDDRLEDKHWHAEMRDVELFENERFAARAAAGGGTGGDGGIGAGAGSDGGWAKTNLRHGERVAWTRGQDGWGGVSPDGSGDVRCVVCFQCLVVFAVRSRLLAKSDGLAWIG